MKKIVISLLALSSISLVSCSFGKKEELQPFPSDPHEKVELKYTYSDFVENNTYNIDAAPSKGKAKLLVVPVWFTDSSTYISVDKKDKVRDDIEKAYFGSNDETGWRSVKTYYEELSKGELEITGVVTDWYESGIRSTVCRENETNTLVESVVEWYKSTSGDTSLTSFDCDNNGYLDGVMLIYAAPDYVISNSRNDNLWAYCYWLQKNNSNVNNPAPNVFFWASYDFMYGSKGAVGRYHSGDTSHCKIDAHTYIHEMGHVFGLDDYYDYSGKWNPAGGFSMQDYNIGSHDPFSALALGWAKPYVPQETSTYNIKPFQEESDLIILSNHVVDSPFDEYILLELYTPTGLNEFDSTYQYSNSYPKGPSTPGIRLWHVDARLVYSKSVTFNSNNITTDPTTTKGRVSMMMSNTYYASDSVAYISPLGKDYADYNLLQLIRNSSSITYTSTDNLSSSSLFKTGDTFIIDSFSKQFVNKNKLNSKEGFSWEISFDNVASNGATITVTKID